MAIILRMSIFFALLIWGISALLYPAATFMEVVSWIFMVIATTFGLIVTWVSNLSMDIVINVLTVIYVDIPMWIFNTFHGFLPEKGADATFFTLLQLAGATILALSLPIVWCLTMATIMLGTLYALLPRCVTNAVSHSYSPEIENMKHLINGRTTVQGTFDAQVQANEIVLAQQRIKQY